MAINEKTPLRILLTMLTALATVAHAQTERAPAADGPGQSPAGGEDSGRRDPAGPNTAPGGAQRPFAVWLAHAESDNVARADGGGRARGSYDGLGTQLDLEHARPRLRAGVVGSLEFRHYAENVSEDERVGNLATFLDASLVPERLSWTVEDSYVQGRSDPFGADTPENRENINVFSTGPELDLPVGERTFVNLGANYGTRTYTTSNFLDSDVQTYEAGLFRRTRPRTLVGVSADKTEIDYETTSAGYDIESVRLSYARTLASGSVNAALGDNTLILPDRETSEPLLELSWVREITARSRVTISGNSGYTDAGRLFELRPDQVAIDVLLTSDATNRRRVSLRYELELGRTSLALGASGLRDEFAQDAAFDSDGREVTLDITRQVARLTTIGFDYHTVRRQFTRIGTDNTDAFMRLWLSRRFSQQVSLDAHLQKSRRDGVDGYDETLYQFTLTYAPVRRGN